MEKKLQVFGSSICGFEGMYQNLIYFKCASGSGVEHHLAKVGAAGSNPVSRFDIEKISKKLLTNENSYDTISELLLKKLATTNLDN